MTKRVAMLSVHTCPLAGLGGRDTGGMYVYVRQLARELARRNIAVDVFTRQRFGRGPRIVEDGPGVRVIHLEAGPPGPMDKETIYEHLPEFAARVDEFRRAEGLCYDRIHAHYWLSGLVAADLRRRWNVPTLVMFGSLVGRGPSIRVCAFQHRSHDEAGHRAAPAASGPKSSLSAQETHHLGH